MGIRVPARRESLRLGKIGTKGLHRSSHVAYLRGTPGLRGFRRIGGSVAHKAALFCGLAVLVQLGTSCDRAESGTGDFDKSLRGQAAPEASSDELLSPIETVRRVHQYRLAGQLGRIRPYLTPDQRFAVVELIQAVDRLAWANEALQAAVTKHIGRASASAFDRSQVANIIGVFSKDVEAIAERVEGDRAVVTIQVGRRVPLDEVDLIRHEGRWLIQTDTPIPGVAAELRKLADVFIDATRRLEKERLTAIQLAREIEAREAAIGRRLAALTQQDKGP